MHINNYSATKLYKISNALSKEFSLALDVPQQCYPSVVNELFRDGRVFLFCFVCTAFSLQSEEVDCGLI